MDYVISLNVRGFVLVGFQISWRSSGSRHQFHSLLEEIYLVLVLTVFALNSRMFSVFREWYLFRTMGFWGSMKCPLCTMGAVTGQLSCVSQCSTTSNIRVYHQLQQQIFTSLSNITETLPSLQLRYPVNASPDFQALPYAAPPARFPYAANSISVSQGTVYFITSPNHCATWVLFPCFTV